MRRRTVLIALATGGVGMSDLGAVTRALGAPDRRERRMPALFVGHGSPMNAIVDTEWSRGWARVGDALPRPSAILCISAHWQTRGVLVTAMDRPPTIHDFSGFPEALHRAVYPAPGSPEVARAAQAHVTRAAVGLDHEWGLDHGAWSVLGRMFPRADVPVVQLSLDATRAPEWHYALAAELRGLRERGVLVMGSGNIVHNLGRLDRGAPRSGFDWAAEFDARIAALVDQGDHRAVVRYEALGRAAALAVPTNEHYLPLLYALGVKHEGEPVAHFNDGLTMGAISMRSLIIG
jgi:4,5-DOPA dioxygenase extradiol